MTTIEKSAEQLQKEIDELYRRKREITERLKDPRGLRRRVPYARNGGISGARPLGLQRGVMRKLDDPLPEDQPPPKRISSRVVKVNDDKAERGSSEKLNEEVVNSTAEKQGGEFSAQTLRPTDIEEGEIDRNRPGLRVPLSVRRDYRRGFKELDRPVEPAPRILIKEENPSMVKRNRRMFGSLLGTLEKFAEEDAQLSSSDALTRRSDSLKRAELKAQEESERLRQQEREQLSEKRQRDLSLRARIAAKAEEKQLELLFIHWTEHHSKLSNFLRTASEPPVYYMPSSPTEELQKVFENQQKDFLEWKRSRREELTKYQKDLTKWHLTNVETEIDKWVNRRNALKFEQEAVGRNEDGTEGSRRRPQSHQEEDGEVEEDFIGDEDIVGNILGEDPKDQEGEKDSKGIVEYASGDDETTNR